MAVQIHPSSVVDPAAQLGADVQIGPFCVIGPEVTLGDRTHVKSHAVVTGWTEIGADCAIFPHATVGEIPQDLKYKGERTRLILGARNRIREGATLHLGTEGGGGVTRIGDDNLLMAQAHVGHDAVLGSRIVVANSVGIAGHCQIGDDVIIGALSGIHQWVRVGKGAIIGGLTGVAYDVIPYGLVVGPRGELEGLNLVGLKRRGLDRAAIAALRAAYKALAEGEGNFMDRARAIAPDTSPEVAEIVAFILGASDRSFLTPK
jgi:UDP-N-acetylglucosamine acyltransferase